MEYLNNNPEIASYMAVLDRYAFKGYSNANLIRYQETQIL